MEIESSRYKFCMDINKSFGEGRYVGSSFVHFDSKISIKTDYDISEMLYYLGNIEDYLRGVSGIPNIILEFDKNPDMFRELKSDLAKSDLLRVVKIMLGSELDNYGMMTEDLYELLQSLVIDKKISYKKFDKILISYIKKDRAKLVKRIYKNARDSIISNIEATQNLKDLLRFLNYKLHGIVYGCMSDELDRYVNYWLKKTNNSKKLGSFMANKEIAFSHKDYLKFRGNPPNRAYLIAARAINTIDDIPPEVLDYDITFKDGKYELDKAPKYIMLFLFDPDHQNLFMTFRRYTDYKLSYYESNINTLFEIKYNE